MVSKPVVSILIASLFLCISCTSTKRVAYFENVPDATFDAQVNAVEAPIQSNDILSISISSLDDKASAVFNTPNNFISRTMTSTGSSTQSGGYLVGTDGYIQLPLLGNILAAGKTKKQLKDNITNVILEKKYLIDPIVDIRYLNFEVTVIGEVAHPTVITVPSEQISLIKALGLAGDLTIYGKRENVLLIREEAGRKTTHHIDLNSPNFLNSPFYYLKPNDVIYVEPNKARVSNASRSQQILPIVIAGLSVAAIVLDRVIK